MNALRRIVDVTSILIVAIALSIAAIHLRSSIVSKYWAHGGDSIEPVAFMRVARSGHWIGAQNASAVIVVYSDYACGFSRQLHSTLQALLHRYPQHLAVSVRQFTGNQRGPRFHVNLGAECAAELGHFGAYHDAVFANAHLIDYTDGWLMLADSAGLRPLEPFADCVRSMRLAGRLSEQHDEARRLGVRAVPTSFVNGTRVVGAAGASGLDSLIVEAFPKRLAARRRR